MCLHFLLSLSLSLSTFLHLADCVDECVWKREREREGHERLMTVKPFHSVCHPFSLERASDDCRRRRHCSLFIHIFYAFDAISKSNPPLWGRSYNQLFSALYSDGFSTKSRTIKIELFCLLSLTTVTYTYASIDAYLRCCGWCSNYE